MKKLLALTTIALASPAFAGSIVLNGELSVEHCYYESKAYTEGAIILPLNDAKMGFGKDRLELVCAIDEDGKAVWESNNEHLEEQIKDIQSSFRTHDEIA